MKIELSPDRNRRRKPNPVTLIVGIKCHQGVVFASDSRHTYGSFTREDGVKLEVVQLANMEIIVGQAGDVDSTTLCTEAIKRLAVDVTATSDNDIRKLIDNATRSVTSEVAHNQCITTEQLRESRLKNPEPYVLLVGFVINDQPYIYSSQNWGLAIKSTKTFSTTGSGNQLAEYLLKENCEGSVDLDTATILAAYCIDLSKKNDAYCGGATQIAVSHVSAGMEPPATVVSTRRYTRQRIADIAKVTAELELWLKKERVPIFAKKLGRIVGQAKRKNLFY